LDSPNALPLPLPPLSPKALPFPLPPAPAQTGECSNAMAAQARSSAARLRTRALPRSSHAKRTTALPSPRRSRDSLESSARRQAEPKFGKQCKQIR
jgi:hypothetical protein